MEAQTEATKMPVELAPVQYQRLRGRQPRLIRTTTGRYTLLPFLGHVSPHWLIEVDFTDDSIGRYRDWANDMTGTPSASTSDGILLPSITDDLRLGKQLEHGSYISHLWHTRLAYNFSEDLDTTMLTLRSAYTVAQLLDLFSRYPSSFPSEYIDAILQWVARREVFGIPTISPLQRYLSSELRSWLSVSVQPYVVVAEVALRFAELQLSDSEDEA
ncbi:hypothetical protein BAUCODRAFT_127483 [Baudoinia panamericana UAMH 10762]|uniref:Uncharacterized protein n=1 Tax=Baudoinia panamericana (strain UAMH 10762) TaxID=717646 RepID=M2LB19_BAUPA|nr:uncharacterized protein BAUCODRAFT_127483 [Baudoinia panamericana UAMH 10762]EMC90997.1 hypothetical protein BAUCODRAFT_127483 [Baudoinia panamericana UAMH 10762]